MQQYKLRNAGELCVQYAHLDVRKFKTQDLRYKIVECTSKLYKVIKLIWRVQ